MILPFLDRVSRLILRCRDIKTAASAPYKAARVHNIVSYIYWAFMHCVRLEATRRRICHTSYAYILFTDAALAIFIASGLAEICAPWLRVVALVIHEISIFPFDILSSYPRETRFLHLPSQCAIVYFSFSFLFNS